MNAAKTRWSVGIIIVALAAVAPIGCSQDWSSVCPAKGTTVLSVYTPARSLSEHEKPTASRYGDRNMALGAGDTSTWTAAVDGDWTDTGNWNPAEVPIDQVHLYFPAIAPQGPDENLDQSARDFRSLFTEEDSEYDIGESGNPLKCTVDNTTLVPSINHGGNGTLYYNCESTGAHETSSILIRSTNMDAAAVIGGDTDIASLVITSGRTEVLTTYSGDISRILVRRRFGAAVDPVLLLDTHATALATLIAQVAGEIICKREVVVLSMSGGIFTQESESLAVVRQAGGVLIFNTSVALGEAYLQRGVFDSTQTGALKTITGLYRFPEMTFVSDEHLTITNNYKIFGEVVD